MDPVVSVIMTVYNGEKYLEQAVASISKQTLTNFEFVIVDDGSTDCTSEILARAAKNDPRIKIITSQRIGRAKALNVAWKNTTGNLIANLDADDFATPDRLEKQVEYFAQHPKTGLLGTARRKMFTSQFGTKETVKEEIYIPPTEDAEIRKTLAAFNPFCHSTVMIPRPVLEQVGGYNEKLVVAIDYDLWVRIGRYYPMANLPEVMVDQLFYETNFFKSISQWKKYKTGVSNRFYAWRYFKRPVWELVNVFNPRRYLAPWIMGYYHRVRSSLGKNRVKVGKSNAE